jgi:hypothetical protein
MLIEKGLPPFLWAEAVAHAAYNRNRSPTKALDGMTPHEAWTGEKPDVSHFREFGCDVWVLNQGEKGSKLDPKSSKMRFVGFADEQRAIRFYDQSKRTIRVSRNVVFNENDDLQTVNVTSDLPGLQLEGESGPDVDLQTPENLERRSEPQDSPQTSTPLTGEAGPSAPAPYTRPSRAVDRDYRQLNNPLARPTTRAIREPLDA